MATQGTYYLDAPSLSAASVIYDDANLTTVAADGFYSDGTNCYTVSSPHSTTTGIVTSVDSCPPPTPPPWDFVTTTEACFSFTATATHLRNPPWQLGGFFHVLMVLTFSKSNKNNFKYSFNRTNNLKVHSC